MIFLPLDLFLDYGVLDEPAVSVRGHPDQIMIAFVVFSLKNPPSEPEQHFKNLRDALPLPPYTCPTALFPLERLPATINGQLDQRAIDEITPSPHELINQSINQSVTQTEPTKRRPNGTHQNECKMNRQQSGPASMEPFSQGT